MTRSLLILVLSLFVTTTAFAANRPAGKYRGTLELVNYVLEGFSIDLNRISQVRPIVQISNITSNSFRAIFRDDATQRFIITTDPRYPRSYLGYVSEDVLNQGILCRHTRTFAMFKKPVGKRRQFTLDRQYVCADGSYYGLTWSGMLRKQ